MTMTTEARRILVVDDNDMNRMLLRHIFEGEGSDEIIEAGNGLEALGLMKESRIDLLLLDVRMPIMDGEETLKQLKQDVSLCDIPVILISGARDELTERCLKLGAAGFASKPYDIEGLHRKVDELTRR